MAQIDKRHFAVLSGGIAKLQYELKRFGLYYQMAYGDEHCSLENSFIVWNKEYTFEQFQLVMLGLCELYKLQRIYIVQKIDGRFDVTLWETASLENIEYKAIKQFSKLKFKDVLEYLRIIKLGKMVENLNAASGSCFICNYVRYARIKDLEERLNKATI